jgi:TANK-binding kinase 1
MKDLLEKQVTPAITQHSECLADWYKMAQTVFLQTQILDKDIDNYNRILESFSLRTSQEGKERYEHISRTIDTWLPRVGQQSSKTINKSEDDMDEIRKRRALMEENKWKDICSMQKQILMILYKNNKLVDELNRYTINEMTSSSSTEDLQLLATGN